MISSTTTTMTIVFIAIAILSTAEGFTVPSMQSRSSTAFVNPSKFALNFAETKQDSTTFAIDQDMKNDSMPKTPIRSEFFLSQPEQEIDFHGLDELAPLERKMLRMEGFEPYVLVSVLASSSSYATIGGIQLFPGGHFDPISALLLASSTISAASGVYATAIFSMSILYGKTALGMGKEELYHSFMETTKQNRFRGYKAFSMSLAAFMGDIFLGSIHTLPEPVQGGAAIVAAGLMAFCGSEFSYITKAAHPLFSNVDKS